MSNARDMVSIRRPAGNMFSEVPKAKIPRSQFDRSHGLKTTFDADRIIPIYVEEVLPGDTVTLRTRGFARLFSPLKAPIMDNLHLDVHYFYVPYRLLWSNWEKFNGAQDDPGDSIDYTIPVCNTGSTSTLGKMADYMGIPLGATTTDNDISALPFRAYRLIYNQWYRDENLVDSLAIDYGDGPDPSTGFGGNPKKRAKKHDYFTSALPWPQKGDAVTIPTGDRAPILGIGKTDQTYGSGPTDVYETNTTAQQTYVDSAAFGTSFHVEEDTDKPGYPAIYADLNQATATTINELRQAFQIQRLLERDARAGTRYVEILKAHFGVTSPDFRLQRAEYLGGGKSFINISPVAQTGETGTTSPQGHLTAVGTGDVTGAGFAKSFVEHGMILGLASARPDLTYQQGLDRFWSRQTRYDFYWPALATIGEQSVLKRELYVTNTATDDQVFGYQERYAEYRYSPSRVSGKFRSSAAGSLDIWHLAQDFAAQPALNQTFIEYDTDMARIQAVTTEPDFLLDVWFESKWARPMPLYGTPGMIDHF